VNFFLLIHFGVFDQYAKMETRYINTQSFVGFSTSFAFVSKGMKFWGIMYFVKRMGLNVKKRCPLS
jgi:hypothetical protein